MKNSGFNSHFFFASYTEYDSAIKLIISFEDSDLTSGALIRVIISDGEKSKNVKERVMKIVKKRVGITRLALTI